MAAHPPHTTTETPTTMDDTTPRTTDTEAQTDPCGRRAAASYTAGPWHVSIPTPSEIGLPVCRDGGEAVAYVMGPFADGDLVAAAPDMYEALQAILDCWDGPKYAHYMMPNIQRARAALAKARREAV